MFLFPSSGSFWLTQFLHLRERFRRSGLWGGVGEVGPRGLRMRYWLEHPDYLAISRKNAVVL